MSHRLLERATTNDLPEKTSPKNSFLYHSLYVCRSQVEFVPTDDRVYSLKMAVRIASTTKHASVVLQGRVSKRASVVAMLPLHAFILCFTHCGGREESMRGIVPLSCHRTT